MIHDQHMTHPADNWNRARRTTRKGPLNAEIVWHDPRHPVLYIDGKGHSDLDRRDLYGSAEAIIARLEGR